MQMMPPVKQTTEDSTLQSGRVPRLRLFFLATTAAIASGLGIALGSTVRFQILPVGQTSLFKPQQDFPPLAEWPPQVPLVPEHQDFGTNWEEDFLPPQLVYNERLSRDADDYDVYDADVYDVDDYDVDNMDVPLSEDVQPVDLPSPIPAHSNDKDVAVQDVADNEGSSQDVLPSVVSTSTDNVDEPGHRSDTVNSADKRHEPMTTTSDDAWFDEQPTWAYPLVDMPVDSTAEESANSPDLLSD